MVDEGQKQKTKIHLMALLEKEGFMPYIIVDAKSGSSYIGFRERSEVGKIRIADHPERAIYGYRWHLRFDMTRPMTVNNKGHRQYFYPVKDMHKMVDHIKHYWKVIEREHELSVREDTQEEGA